MSSEPKIMLLGSIPVLSESKTFGGATILMKSLKDYFQRENINYTFIQLNKYPYSTAKSYFHVLLEFLKNMRKVEIVFINVSSNGAFYLAPLIVIISKLFSKKVIFRVFGSNFEKVFSSKYSFLQYIAKHTFFKANLIIAETMKNINFFKSKHVKTIFWLPNVRTKPNRFEKKSKFHKRIVFISHVKKSKGVLDIIESSNFLDSSYLIDVYGPIEDSVDVSDFENSRVNYKGVLLPTEVLNKLSEYDLVLLPTYYDGEGHPGILIEAMSIGVPCISTKWNSISEVVIDGYNGFLIPIKSPKIIASSIKKFNDENYHKMSQNALLKFEDFEENNVYKKLISKIRDL